MTGETAQSRDFNDLMKGNAPIVFAFVLSIAFLLLLFTFRSIVIPIKAIVLNLLRSMRRMPRIAHAAALDASWRCPRPRGPG